MLDKIFSPETYSMLGQWALGFCKNLLVAIIVFVIGRWIIKWVKKLVVKMLERSKVDSSLYSFLTSIVNVVLWFTLIIIIISILGIETSSFIALFASAGVAIGMAMSGNLNNLAGGLIILLLKPFKVGDFVEAQGQFGTVKAIQIFHTIITGTDNKEVYIPNGVLSSGSIINYSINPIRRMEWAVGVEYGEDFERVETVLMRIFSEEPRILKDPAPYVILKEMADSKVNIYVRGWVKNEDYYMIF